MASDYTGNPNATEVPSPAPGPGVIPKKSIPAGTDALSIESIAQDMKVDADFIGHIQSAVRLDTPVVAGSLGFSAVTYNAFGTGTVTPSNARIADGLRVVVKIVTPGAAGVATYVISTDGGATFSAVPQTSGTPAVDTTTGIWLTFGAGTFDTDGTASFRSGYTPQAMWSDSNGNARFLIDHNGYPLGRIGRWSEMWTLSNIVAATGLNAGASGLLADIVPGWYYDTNATDNTWSANTQIANGLSSLRLNYGNGGVSSDGYLYPAGVLFDASWTGLCAVVEWYGAIGVSGTTTIADHYMGLNGNPTNGGFTYNGRYTGSTGSGPMRDGVFFRCPAAGNGVTTTTIHCVAKNLGTETDVNSGVQIGASGTMHAFKLELYGSGNPGGAKARYFIDGNIITEITTNLPASVLKFAYGGHITTLGSSALYVAVGGLNAVWNLNELSIPAL